MQGGIEKAMEKQQLTFFFFNWLMVWGFFGKFIYFNFWLHWVLVAACGLSLVAASGGLLFVAVCGLLIAVASVVEEYGL